MVAQSARVQRGEPRPAQPASVASTASTRARRTASPMAGPAGRAPAMRALRPPQRCRRPAPRAARQQPLRAAGRARRSQAEPAARVALAGQQGLARSARAGAARRSARAGAACAAAPSPPLRCTLPCSRATTSASSRQSPGTRSRSHSARSELDAAHFVADVARPARRAGVLPLPRSCTRQAKRTGSGGLQPRADVEHHHQVHAGVDLGVVVGALRHAPQAVDLGQQRGPARRSRAARSNMRDGRGFHQAARQFLPDALGHQRVDLAVVDHLAHQRQRLAARREVGEARGETRHAQDAHRVLGEGRATHGAARRPAGRAGRRRGRSALPSPRPAMALIVRSRRDRSCFQRHVGSAWTVKPW